MGSEGVVVNSLCEHPLEVSKIAVQYCLGKRLLGAEVIGEGAQRNTSGFADIAYSRPCVSRSKHHLEAGIKKVFDRRSEEHTSELQSHLNLVCRLLLEKKKKSGILIAKRTSLSTS